MLEALGLTKWYGGFRAVTDVSFTLAGGEILGYVGPNGSGKTSTVNMVTGLILPTAGEVRFDGTRIDADLVAFRRHVGCVPEEPHLYPYLSGREHLELVAGLRGMDDGVAARRIDALLDILDLGAHRALGREDLRACAGAPPGSGGGAGSGGAPPDAVAGAVARRWRRADRLTLVYEEDPPDSVQTLGLAGPIGRRTPRPGLLPDGSEP